MLAADFVAGCLGGCAGLLVGHPFDTVKVHMQTQSVKNPKYRGSFDCLKSLMVKESFRGLYRGMSSPMVSVSAINAVVFGVYGNIQRMSSNPDSYMSHFVAGSAAGFVQSGICSPMELAKTQLQLQTHRLGVTKFNGPIQCLSYAYHCNGIRGIFRGLGATTARDVPGFASYFVSYEFLMQLKQDPSILYTLFCGGTAGAISWTFTIPIDVIKSRLQIDGMNGEQKMYNGIIDCFRKSYNTEGCAFLTRGLSSTLLRAFPMNAVCFVVVSETIKHWHYYFEAKPLTKAITEKQTIKRTEDHWQHKRRIIQGLLHFSSAFNDAICPSEIVEVAYDWFENNKIQFSNNRVNFKSNYERYLDS